jgi:hypothetical protein
MRRPAADYLFMDILNSARGGSTGTRNGTGSSGRSVAASSAADASAAVHEAGPPARSLSLLDKEAQRAAEAVRIRELLEVGGV